MKADEILNHLELMFPNAKCELNHRTNFQLLCAVILSAQTTDIAVNKVTGDLFKKYPNPESMSKAKVEDIEQLIRAIGLYRNKAANLLLTAKILVNEYDGIVPNDFLILQKLPGVGRKTANVIMAEAFLVPSLAVDTHVERVSKRLGLVPKTKDVLHTELILKKKIDQKRWIKAHHLFIFFGRYKCKAKNPNCDNCPFIKFCRYQKELKNKN